MGMAASQARLLTLTARIADNELRSQTINNAKMRLAAESSQASNDYVSALNNAQYLFNSTDINGTSIAQALNFNALSAYSPYNTQYGLTNSSGLLLVSENDADNFKAANGNLNKFLEKYGLSWDTTYFDNDGNGSSDSNSISKNMQNVYSNSVFADLYENKTNNDLKALYEKYNANRLSLEVENYKKVSTEYYNVYSKLRENAKNEWLNTLCDGKSVQDFANTYAEGVDNAAFISGLKGRIISQDHENDDILNLYNKVGAGKYLNSDAINPLVSFVNSNFIGYLDGNGKYYYSTSSINLGNEIKKLANGNYEITLKAPTNDEKDTISEDKYVLLSIEVSAPSNNGKTLNDFNETKVQSYSVINQTTSVTTSTSTTTTTKEVVPNYYTPGETPFFDFLAGINYKIDSNEQGSSKNNVINGHYTYDGNSGKLACYNLSETDDPKSVIASIVGEYIDVLTSQVKNEDGDLIDTFDFNKYLNDINQTSSIVNEYKEAKAAFDKLVFKDNTSPVDVTQAAIVNIEELLNKVKNNSGADENYIDKFSDKFKNILDAKAIELMIDEFGEPKYNWVDKNDKMNVGNSEVKAQWYTNLFNRMSKGYKTLEDGLASSSEWIRYAFESGLVTMEQVDTSFNWQHIDYKSCASITENTDTSAMVAKAEAKYNRAMNDIKQKDQIYDLQLKNLDTEHNALQTEYDVVKKVLDKNIDRTMKFNQSA